jgi:TolB-like protein/DNA-binding winged helix-turn-helix (wHTH) protein
MSETVPICSVIRFGTFEVDLRKGELRKSGLKLRLTGQPFQVLAILLEHPGEVVTRDELRKRLWTDATFVDFDHGLNAVVNRLREALGESPDSPRFIETIPRQGYRFVSAVDGPLVQGQGKQSQRSKRKSIVGAALVSALTIALAGFAVYAIRQYSLVAAGRGQIRSLAVLPMDNFTGDPSEEYFADGMTDALITELAQVRGLKVISRTSVLRYKGARKALSEIARELGVDGVVEGAVGRSDGHVKITAQLIRASTDTHLWAASYVGVQQDILRLQAEVARDVARQIGDQLISVESRPESKPTVNPAAYDAYLKGNFLLNGGTPDGRKTAMHYFQEAIAKDPNFASAYSGLARCYNSLSFMSEMPSTEAYASAKEAAQKALVLDNKLDQAHAALAWIAISDWDWRRAEAEYKSAIQLNPNSADAGYFLLLLILQRSEDAVQEERRISTLDPLSTPTLSTGISSAYFRRQYKDGLVKARTAIELYPQVPIFHDLLSNIYAALGNEKLSAHETLLAEKFDGSPPDRLAALGTANAMGGLKGLRRKRIELNKQLAAKRYVALYDIAVDCAAVGDKDQAIAWLERALRAHDPKIPLINVEPIFDSLRSDVRFVALLRQMKLNSTHL